jgi:hypothetical protein
MRKEPAFLVSVRHNLVCEVAPVEAGFGIDVPATKLDVSAQLAASHRDRGCIDGDYYFEDSATARRFAFLCQDFIKKLVDRTLAELEEARFMPDDHFWRNSLVASAKQPGKALLD